jgi:hypothetical protein
MVLAARGGCSWDVADGIGLSLCSGDDHHLFRGDAAAFAFQRVAAGWEYECVALAAGDLLCCDRRSRGIGHGDRVGGALAREDAWCRSPGEIETADDPAVAGGYVARRLRFRAVFGSPLPSFGRRVGFRRWVSFGRRVRCGSWVVQDPHPVGLRSRQLAAAMTDRQTQRYTTGDPRRPGQSEPTPGDRGQRNHIPPAVGGPPLERDSRARRSSEGTARHLDKVSHTSAIGQCQSQVHPHRFSAGGGGGKNEHCDKHSEDWRHS